MHLRKAERRGLNGCVRFLFGGSVLCLAASAVPEANARQLPNRLSDSAISGAGWFNVERKLTEADFSGRPVLVEFWATWCAPCLEQVPTLNDLHERYADRGLIVLAVTEDEPSKVAPYVERLGMKYAVAAGIPPRRKGRPKELPFAALYSAKGMLVMQGAPSQVYARAHVMMHRSPPDGPFSDLTKRGARVGDFPLRPEKYRPFVQPALEQKLTEFEGEGSVISEAELQEIYAFYWMNLPVEGWSGDEETRQLSNTALLQIHMIVHNEDRPETLASLRRELLRRISQRDPDMLCRMTQARHMAYIFGPDDAQALAALRLALKRERGPVLRYYLSRSLALIDSSLPELPSLRSPFLDAQKWYRESSTGWTSVFGPPADLAAYPEYVERLDEYLERSGVDLSIIRRLEADYGKRAGQKASDLLIRGHIAGTLNGFTSTARRESSDLRKALQRTALRLLQTSEPDTRIRLLLLWLSESAGVDAETEKQVVKRLEEMLSSESNPQVRATIERVKLVILDPDALK